jgi:hypothetical protein
MGKIRVFCSGCTEHLSIDAFLKKVNPRNDYIVTDRKTACKKSIQEVRKYVYKDTDNKLKVVEENANYSEECRITGKSGKALRKNVAKQIEIFYRRNTYSDFIFIDDLDCEPFADNEFDAVNYWDIIREFEHGIEIELKNNIPEVKLVVLMAIPEIESWLMYAWDTAFVEYYQDVPLINAIKSYLQENEFKNHWDNFDEWCSKAVFGKYYKISEVLIESFNKIQHLDLIEQSTETMPYLKYLGVESIIYRHENSMLKRYEKKKDGPQILAMLEPTVLETKSRYLKDKLYKIREIV